jgi:hypothetical protein
MKTEPQAAAALTPANADRLLLRAAAAQFVGLARIFREPDQVELLVDFLCDDLGLEAHRRALRGRAFAGLDRLIERLHAAATDAEVKP